MLRTTAIGSACIIALALCAASPAGAAKGGSPGGSAGHSVGGSAGSMGTHSVGGSAGPGPGSFSGSAGPGSFSRISGPGPGSIGRSFAVTGPSTNHIMTAMGHDRDHYHDRDLGQRFDRDRDHDHDHDRFRHRLFPEFVFGVNTYPDIDEYEDCYVLQKVLTRHGPRLRRLWVCS